MAHRVLLVDDSQATRAFAEAALEEGGFEVECAAGGAEALKLMPQHQFAVLITDINMPDINGLELIRFARSNERYRDTPVLIISTEGTEIDVQRAMDLGATEFLAKPFTPEQLVELVRRHVPAE